MGGSTYALVADVGRGADMRWFLDTEFAEDGERIRLISLALVSERDDRFYRVLSDGWSVDDCNDWVRQHVLPLLPPRGPLWSTREQTRKDVTRLLMRDGTPEIWADYGSYDWVALCQLFGTMMDLPSGMPMFVRDLRQEVFRLGVSQWDLPSRKSAKHDALEDSLELRDRWVWLTAAHGG